MTAHEALSHPFVDPEARKEGGDLLPTIKKNFNARRTLHAAIDTVRAINKLREGGAQGFMDGAMSVDPKKQQQQQQQQQQHREGDGQREGGGGDAMEGVEMGGGQTKAHQPFDSRGHARGQTEEMIRIQQQRVQDMTRGLWSPPQRG